MFKRIITSRLPLIVYNPSKVFSLNFFKAVFNAGSLPVFDTEFLSHYEIVEGIKALISADILFGLRLVDPNLELISDIKELNASRLESIVISLDNTISQDSINDYDKAGDNGSVRDKVFESVKSINKNFPHSKIILEVREININDRIKEINPHALILRGNEASGRVSNYSSFILMQWYLKNSELPVFIHGGVGRNTASGMFAAGVSGVVLDSQVWLSDESPLSANFKNLLSSLDESDSIEITTDSRNIFRVFAKLGTKIAKELKEKAILISANGNGSSVENNSAALIYKEIGEHITPLDKADAPAVQSLFFIGQDGFFAKNFALISSNLKDMISGFFKEIGEQLAYVDSFDPMKPNSAMAKEHGTRLPLIQGPMANVSDNADFAAKVLEAGAMPFFAVGSLPPALAENMIKRGAEKVPVFGAGLVGIEAFNPAVEKHLEIVRQYKAPFALFAGGIPSQVIDLEKAGTKTYLHTPSISMMENAIKGGCTRFIFEGREAGGHVGSLSSLVLWEAAIAKIKERLASESIMSKETMDSNQNGGIDNKNLMAKLSLVFAGGISTCFASCFISGIASCLAAKGVKIGIQVGTAYLFSKEIVETKSIKEQYQTILCQEDETMVIGNSVGLASRTAPTDFAKKMIQKEKEMIKKGEKLEDRKRAFEKNNIGSLLIGAKGFLPDFKNPGEANYRWFEGEEHKNRGNFLSGDALAFFKDTTTIDKIHGMFFDISYNHAASIPVFSVKEKLFSNLNRLEVLSSETKSINDEIAVIGMGCILPDAKNPEELWDNILAKRYSIREMEDSRIRKDLYYDPDKTAEDKAYTMLAGYIKDFAFDRDRFGYDEQKAAHLSRSQQILLMAAYQAVENAGYLDENLRFGIKNNVMVNPERTAVIIATCLGNELGNELQFKYHFPEVLSMLRKTEEFNKLSQEEKSALTADLQKGMEGSHSGYDPVHGMLLNIEASRVARHLGIRGVNYVVDAACASSFSAIDAAVKELLSGDCDHVVVGGVNTHLAPESFIGFCKMGALSAKGSFPFDERADGFILGEGAAVFVLKRVKDALRDNDNIIGIIKGIGGSSDGRGKAIAAPNVKGQILALERCYERMDGRVKPQDIGFIEAHGTSTIMGDQAELQTLKELYSDKNISDGGENVQLLSSKQVSEDSFSRNKIGISSVKSQIGHLLGGAGAAGLVKALLAVQKGVLPPNANFEKLSHNHDLSNTNLYIIENPEPWVTPENKTRKAAVSSYGFGGINYHLVVEEFRGKLYDPMPRRIFAVPDYDFNDNRIVIAGIGVCLPGGQGIDEFWHNLQSGEKQFSLIPTDRFDNQAYSEFDKKSHYYLPMVKAGIIQDFKFNNIKYRMPPSIVRSLERGQLLGLEAADDAINSSGLVKFTQSAAAQPSSGGASNKIGVILGTIQGDRQSKNILRVRKNLLAEIIKKSSSIDAEQSKLIASQLVDIIRQRLPENNEDTTPGLLSNIISGRIANHFGLNGVNYVVDASCASSVIAIRNAMREISSKQLDFVLAGGVDANLYPAFLMAFKRIGLLSPTEPRFFDSRADGYVMSEGAAIHVLTTLKRAKKSGMEILGELSDFTVKSSAPDHLLSPSEPTFVSAINECYRQNGIRKQDVGYLDLFAFSNVMGDMVERQVVEKCFDLNNPNLHFGNIKIQFGYFKSANPAVALAKIALMNKHRTLLPNFDYDPKFSTLKNPIISGQKYDTPFHFAFNVNGIGGNHGHAVLSMVNRAMLFGQAEALGKSDTLQAQDGGIIDTAKNSHSQTLDSQRGDQSQIVKPSKQTLAALLSGQGSQSAGMMKEIFEKDSDIRQIMEQGEAIFVKERGYSLLNMMFSDDNRLNLTENTQPAVFLSSAAIFSKLSNSANRNASSLSSSSSSPSYTASNVAAASSFSDDFNPDFFIGHSVGEYTALFCSGMLNFDDAMRLIIKRSDLMREAAIEYPGKIMVVFGNEQETASLIRESGASWLYITNKNSERQTAVSGSEQDIDIFCKFLASKNVVYKRLNLSGAFHTPLFSKAAEKLKSYLKNITFNNVNFTKVISNVTARPYPQNPEQVKELLAKQITTPVEFIKSIEYVNSISKGGIAADINSQIKSVSGGSGSTYFIENSGNTHFMEIGPRKLLVNLLKNINIKNYSISVALDSIASGTVESEILSVVNENAVVISGVSVGLPGKARRVFSSDNFDMILDGRNFIDPLSVEDQERIVDKNITRILKEPDGNARFVEISNTEDVIHLAGQLGYFNLTEEYGIKAQYDISMALAVAAGIEALKDAGIPLVMQYKTPSRFKRTDKGYNDGDNGFNVKSTGRAGNNQKADKSDSIELIPDGFALPQEMQDDTGVIITSLFPSNETLINEMEKYFYDRLFLKPYEEFQSIYFYLMENVKDTAVKQQVTDWFFNIRKRKREDFGAYKFDRNFMVNACPLGSAHLAQIIKAKGPNVLVSSACASTTQAVGIAEDWIKLGRCKRVVVIGGENATSSAQNQWIGSGFLALGAATVKKRISEAAKPFDSDRNGTILGCGAVGLVVEKASEVHARGMRGQAVVLGTHMANSAYHTFNIDVEHMAGEMKKFISKMEKEHNLKQSDYADKLLFMSHETYTPARGGSADAEVTALKTTFGNHLKNICITNTKGFTGHTLGAAIEDVVMVKALQQRKAPPIANLVKIPEHFKELNFASSNISSGKSDGSRGEKAEYGLHLAAGFGSHFAFLFIRRIEERVNTDSYNSWLKRISRSNKPELKIIDNMLCVVGERSAVIPDSDVVIEVPSAYSNLNLPPAQSPIAAHTTVKADLSSNNSNKISAKAIETPNLTLESNKGVMTVITEIIAKQTGYTEDMLDPELDLEADLGIDTVKQVEIFANAASHFGFPVPEDLKLRDLNTIARLSAYIDTKVGTSNSIQKEIQISSEPETKTAISSNYEASAPVQQENQVMRVITGIIAKQTGYTEDMLDPELDLESDLGIDTVKQVEIFANTASHFGFPVPEDLKLRDLNTISKLTEYIASKVAPKGAASKAEPAGSSDVIENSDKNISVEPVKTSQKERQNDKINLHLNDLDITKEETHDIHRLVPVWRKTGLPVTEKWSFAGKTVVVAGDDTYGIADFIKADGGKIVEIKENFENQRNSSLLEESLKNLDGLILDGLICITPFDVKSFFIIVKKLFSSLNQKDKFIAAFSFADTNTRYRNASFAGICGMMKSLAKEMPNTIVKAVSILDNYVDNTLSKNNTQNNQSLKSQPVNIFMDEIRSTDPRVEISYRNGEKYVVHLTDSPLSKTETDFNQKGLIANGDTILVTGGARGITFEILKAVVKRYQTNLIILGRSDIYNIDALSDIIADVESISSIDEKIVMEKLKLTMKGAKPVELKQAANRILSALESRKNIEILKSFGVYVSYIAADVSDKHAVKSALESVELDHIDGVIHAAGVEESMPFEKKTAESFDRVFNTKVYGCFNVIEAVEEKNHKLDNHSDKLNKDSNKSDNTINKLGKTNQVKFYVGFSSVTAKFGNEGQADYTAANEMMAAILLGLDREDSLPKCKIIDWTAWSGAGMATRETVQKVLTERGLKFLPLKAGVKFFMDEMEDAAIPEVVITGLDHSFDRDGLLKIAPFLDSVSESAMQNIDKYENENGEHHISFVKRLDIKTDRFLLDHAMDGTPIFLGATGVETMAEAAMAAYKTGRISEVKNFSIPYGIKLLQNKPKDIKISVNEDENGIHCKITSQFVNSAGIAMGEPKLHYQSDFVIERSKEILIDSIKGIESSEGIRKKRDVPQILRSNPIGDKNTGLIYHPQRLFMDGVFRTIEDIISFDGNALITKITDRSRQSFFTDDPCPQFLTDVVLLDAMFQTGGVFEFLTDNYIVLPYKIKSLKFFDRAVKDRDYLCITTRTASDSETDTFNIDLIDEDGNYLMELVGFEMVKLNKLSEAMKISG